MLGRADRSAVERRHHRTAIVAVGADVEDRDEGEHGERQGPEAAIRLRQRQAARRPAEPRLFGQSGVATQQDVVERTGAAAGEQQGGAHRQIAGRHRPLVDAGGALPAEHRHQQHREAHGQQGRETGQQPGHQHRPGDQFGGAEQDDSRIKQIEMRQQEADQMIGAEQGARHRGLELVRHPGRRAGVELGRRVDEAARAAAPIDEALDEAGGQQRDRGNAPVASCLGHSGRTLCDSPEGGCGHVHFLCDKAGRISWLAPCRCMA